MHRGSGCEPVAGAVSKTQGRYGHGWSPFTNVRMARNCNGERWRWTIGIYEQDWRVVRHCKELVIIPVQKRGCLVHQCGRDRFFWRLGPGISVYHYSFVFLPAAAAEKISNNLFQKRGNSFTNKAQHSMDAKAPNSLNRGLESTQSTTILHFGCLFFVFDTATGKLGVRDENWQIWLRLRYPFLVSTCHKLLGRGNL